MPDNEKTLIASSEFDPAQFVKGIDLMAAALEKLSQQEGAIQTELKQIDAALKANRSEYRANEAQIKTLDKSSTTYKADLAALTAQKKVLTEQSKTLKTSLAENKTALDQVNKTAETYKTSLVGIATTTKQVADANKGRQLFDVTSLGQQVAEIAEAGSKIRNVFQGKISTSELDHFEQQLAETNDEFVQLGQIIQFVKSKLDTLDPDSEEFAELTRVVATGEQVLEQYGTTVETTAKKTVSARSQLAAMRNELVKLEEQGKENTEEFQQLAIEAGRLDDQIGDTQQRIKVLSSDTRNLDFGIAAIRGVAAAFGVAEGAAAVFGLKTEDVQESLKRLNAIMLILNGLQEIQNALQKQSVLRVVGQEVAFKSLANTLSTFKGALLATGIGAAVVAAGFLITKLIQLSNQVADVGVKQKLLNQVTNDAIKGYTQEVTRLELIKKSLNDVTISQKDRVAIAKDYNKTADEGNKIDLQQIDNIALVNKAIDSQIAKIKERALARAAEAVISQKAEAVLLEQEKARLKNIQLSIDATKEIEGVSATQFQNIGGKLVPITQSDAQKKAQQVADQIKFLKEQVEKDPAVIKAKKELEDALTVLTPLVTPASLISPVTTETNKAKIKEVENEFERKKAELDQQLAEATRKEADTESKIRVEFAARLQKEQLEIQKLLTDKKLTAPQAKILSDEAIEINKVQLENALKDFTDKNIKFRQELDDKLFALQVKAGKERADLIRDQFIREAEQVKQESENQINLLTKERDDLIKKVQDNPAILPSIKESDIEHIKSIYDQLFKNAKEALLRRQEEISNGVFEALQEETRRVFDGVQLVISQTATEEILAATELLRTGAINYEEYQEKLTKIAETESKKRINVAIAEQQAILHETKIEIAKIETKPENDQDKDRLKDLQDQERAIRKQISDLERDRDIKEGEAISKDDQKFATKIARVAEYANAVNSVVQSVISFWQQANEAEQKSLEKSIALQQTRVEAATRLAERGNSEFLRLEEDRLQELQVKQENAARRQIAVNAVLQGSQAITAFISALAQGAATGGALGAIAASAALIALIGAGYAIVQSLQPPTPSFFVGTKEVQRGGHPVGRDTIPAMLHEGEAVIPTSINKEYKPTVAAIFDKKIPAEVINNFVNNYKTVNNGKLQSGEKPGERQINRETKSDSKSYEKDRQVEKHLIERETIDFKALQTIPPDVINNFVNHYKSDKDFRRFYDLENVRSVVNNYPVNNRVLPRIDGEKMGAAAEVHIQADGRLLQATREQTKKIEENTEELREVKRQLKNMGVSVNVDRHGLAVSVHKAIEQFNIDKRS